MSALISAVNPEKMDVNTKLRATFWKDGEWQVSDHADSIQSTGDYCLATCVPLVACVIGWAYVLPYSSDL